MEHSELLQEMQQIEKLPINERVKLAQKRRKQQLTAYAKWAKTDNINNRQRSKNIREVAFAPEVQLMDIAARGSHEDMRNLLKSGIDPNMRNHDGLTALHQACIDGSLELVTLLLKHGADVNITDQDLWTPLHAAATCGHFKIVTTLIKAGANLTAINCDGEMPHDITDDEVTFQYMENEMMKRGITQDIIERIREEPHDVMLRDIKNTVLTGGDLNQPLERKSTFLHAAIANGFNDIVKLLIDNGASLTARDEDGWEPIHAASYWCNEAAIDLLTHDKRVNLQTCTGYGETPYDLCDDPEIKSVILHKISIMSDMCELYGEASPENLTPIFEEVERTTIDDSNEKHFQDININSLESFYSEPQKKLDLFIVTDESLDGSRNPSIDDTPSSPIVNIEAIELSSDRRNSIKEAKHKAELIRSIDRLSTKEKKNIKSDTKSKQTDDPRSVCNKENITPNINPLFITSTTVED
ncbi:hypothetical protein OTU49_000020, partial [Cherax quadricarinatus]